MSCKDCCERWETGLFTGPCICLRNQLVGQMMCQRGTPVNSIQRDSSGGGDSGRAIQLYFSNVDEESFSSGGCNNFSSRARSRFSVGGCKQQQGTGLGVDAPYPPPPIYVIGIPRDARPAGFSGHSGDGQEE